MHPQNTCQPSHVEPLVRLYRGTLSISDRKLIAIFVLFEHTKKSAITSLLSRWSPSPGVVCDNVLQAVQALDPARIWRTCVQYPQWVSCSSESASHNDGHLYDPWFLALLFSCLLLERARISTAAWIQILRTNIGSLLIRSLSARHTSVRQIAMSQIHALYRTLQVGNIPSREPRLLLIALRTSTYTRDRTSCISFDFSKIRTQTARRSLIQEDYRHIPLYTSLMP